MFYLDYECLITITLQIPGFPVSELRLSLDASLAADYCQLDAVKINGSTYGKIMDWIFTYFHDILI